MGDKIAILKEGGILAQYDTPENILSAPNSEFVSSFVGSDRVLKRLSLTRVGDLELEPANGQANDLPRISNQTSLKDALSEMIGAGAERGVVLSDGNVVGSLTLDAIRQLSGKAAK
jgi:osmoprotectant transport system ATP-binding protein